MGVPDCTCHLSCYYYYTYSSAGAPKIAIEDSLDAILRFPGVGAESAVRWFERRARGGMGGGSAFRVGVASSRRGLHRLVSTPTDEPGGGIRGRRRILLSCIAETHGH